MKAVRYIVAAVVAVCSVIGAAAADRDKVETPDSVSAAFATIWGGYLDKVAQEYGGDRAAVSLYADGIERALQLPADRMPLYRGILDGYMVGQRLRQMQQMGIPVDDKAFMATLRASLMGEPTGFTRESADEFLNSYVARQAAGDTVSVASQRDYLAAQAAREGVITTPSGLVFEVIKEGEGASPAKSDRVVVMYTGRLADGTVFDATEEPVTFNVDRLVPGFTEALMLMKPGGRYRAYIPASLGYGAKGIPGVIPGNSALDFDIELIEVLR